jgi:hypothetical protein
VGAGDLLEVLGVGGEDPCSDDVLRPAPASRRAATMISRQRFVWLYASGGSSSPLGMTGAVPATKTWGPTRTAREKPMIGS